MIELFGDNLASDILYNGVSVRAFVSRLAGSDQVIVLVSDVPEVSPRDKVEINGVVRQVRGPSIDQVNRTDGQIHVIDLQPLPTHKRAAG